MSPTSLKPVDIEAKYQRAQTLLQGFWGRNIVPNSTIFPIWIEGSDCFWYERDVEPTGGIKPDNKPLQKWDKEYRLVNAATATNTLAFDHAALASVLAEVTSQACNQTALPIGQVKMALNSSDKDNKESVSVSTLHFKAFKKDWVFDTASNSLSEVQKPSMPDHGLLSPDGQQAIFTRDDNLWVHDVNTGEERALTDDGEEDNAYAAPANGWGHDDSTLVQACWSSDSKRILTLQRDTRQVLTLPTVYHIPCDGSLRPKVSYTKVAMPGDEHVPEYRLLSIEVATGAIQPVNYRRIPIVRNSNGFFVSNLSWWHTDNRLAYFVDMERDYKTVRLVELDTHTGDTRILFEENAETQINLMLDADEHPTLVPLPETNELIWFSERSGWAHLYLYDLGTGSLKRSLTSGEWVVRGVLSIDAARREI